ncbi:esterase FE4-like [Vanessa atalanta]|uniref:esterase FE4-like n=1 Tax=Vanessa atalanta TaxID=42275 RepID=UPI001FCDF240|nr:esterase FE4-like [Vanessa atalanta]
MGVVSINQGKLKGGEAISDNGVPYYEFLGIPYAKPPIGNLRFKNPQPPESWDGERDATAINEKNICCQIDMMKGNPMGSEDCLYLNVYTPKLPEMNTKPLPVMVFVHGGGFIYSNGIVKKDLGPDYLIDNDVVVVTFNYRLGVLGFLSLDIPEAPGNMGLKDQVQALKWVQNNISKFGGDPENITIFGISAGSVSVDYLLLSPLAKGLFHKAILQSGSSLNHWAINYEPKNIVNKLLEKMEYSGSTQDERAIYEYLMESPISKLLEGSYKAIDNFTTNRLFFGFVPTIEKDFGDNEAFITDKPYKLFKEGRFNYVPVIKGVCNKEGYLSNALKPNVVLDVIENKNFVEHWAYELKGIDKDKYSAEFLEAYSENPQPEDESDKIGVDFFSDLDFTSGVWLSGEMMARKGVPVYFYEFCYEGKMNFFKHFFGMLRKGAAHGDDMYYVFKHDVSNFGDAKDKEVRANVCKMWTNFAKTSNPTSEDISIEWTEYKEDLPAYLCIDEKMSIKTDYKPKKMAIFKEIYEKYENNV